VPKNKTDALCDGDGATNKRRDELSLRRLVFVAMNCDFSRRRFKVEIA
jgi:hypothetical protein